MAGARNTKVGNPGIGVYGPRGGLLVPRLGLLAGLLEGRHVRAARASRKISTEMVVLEVRLAEE